MAVSSDSCRSLKYPYVAVMLKVADHSGQVKNKSFEMTIPQFQHTHQESRILRKENDIGHALEEIRFPVAVTLKLQGSVLCAREVLQDSCPPCADAMVTRNLHGGRFHHDH
nr:uncharacterized protein LOC110123152 isoform X1 [Odocoileus virginianus texanus]